MGSEIHCSSEHLTEVEIHQLLREEADFCTAERANRHLDYCNSCQLLLENLAANPHEWKRFVAVMDGQLRCLSPATELFPDTDHSRIEEPLAIRKRALWVSPLTTAIVFSLIIAGTLIRFFPDQLGYWKDRSPTEELTAPMAPPAPDNPGAAPAAPQ